MEIETNSNRVGVSWLNNWRFCPYKMLLTDILQLHAEKSPKQLAGIAAHQLLDDMTIPCEEDLKTLVKNTILLGHPTLPIRDAKVENERMIGRIDELFLSQQSIRIIEDKPRSRTGIIFPSHKLQANGYATVFLSMFPICQNIPLSVVIRDEITLEEMWELPFSTDSESEVMSAVAQIEQIRDGTLNASPTKRSHNCRGCSCNYLCEYYTRR